MLDIWIAPWYIIQARVGDTKAHCDDAGDCVLDGNFRGVCPVIGRLNCFWSASVYRCAMKDGSASVGHFSWLGMIRTAARTRNSSTVPRHYAN